MIECGFKFLGLEVIISQAALEVMTLHRQKYFFSKEAGGQMFARLGPGRWVVEVATGPRPGDRRGRFHFWPDRGAEQLEINAYYQKGLDYVGDWHTHPENQPTPSQADRRSIENIVRNSTHELPGMLMCIVGRSEPPSCLWLSLHTRNGEVRTADEITCAMVGSKDLGLK